MSFSDSVEIIEPQSIREQMKKRLQKMQMASLMILNVSCCGVRCAQSEKSTSIQFEELEMLSETFTQDFTPTKIEKQIQVENTVAVKLKFDYDAPSLKNQLQSNL